MPFVKIKIEEPTDNERLSVIEVGLLVDRLQAFWDRNLFTHVHTILDNDNSRLMGSLDDVKDKIISKVEKLGYKYEKI